MAFQSVFSAFKYRPRAQYFSNRTGTELAVLRDNFSIPTWLIMGAFLQGLLSLLPFKNVFLVLPVVLALLYHVGRTMLMAAGIIHNSYMDGVIEGRTAALYPDGRGVYDKPGDKQICIIMLAARSNHPLGMFADGFKETGDYFARMTAELDKNATENGFLGASSWLSSTDRGVSSEVMSLLYFDSPESVHAYAHGPLHTEAMEWWHRSAKKNAYVGLMHEIFSAPKNSWEGYYLNYHPTGLGATSQEANLDGRSVWMNPLVNAKGKLLWSKGRMGRPYGEKEWTAYENALNDDEMY